MNFFTIYKFELKKILFIVFAAVFVMYFSSILMFSQNLNDVFISYLQMYYSEVINQISVVNLIWIMLMAFFQFYNYDLEQRGNLPFSRSSLFLSTALAGITIIAAAALFYWIAAGAEYLRYSFIFSNVNDILSSAGTAYSHGFGIFTFNVFVMFLAMTAAYFTIIIFMLSFKNSIAGCVLWFFWNYLFYSIVYSDPLYFLSIFGWFNYPYYSTLAALNIVSGVCSVNILSRLLFLAFFSAVIAIAYISAFAIFSKTENSTKNIAAKSKPGEFIIFADVGMFVFNLLRGNLNYYESSVSKKAVMILFSVLTGIVTVLITKVLYKGGKRK